MTANEIINAALRQIKKPISKKYHLTEKLYREVYDEVANLALKEWFLPPKRDKDHKETEVV